MMKRLIVVRGPLHLVNKLYSKIVTSELFMLICADVALKICKMHQNEIWLTT